MCVERGESTGMELPEKFVWLGLPGFRLPFQSLEAPAGSNVSHRVELQFHPPQRSADAFELDGTVAELAIEGEGSAIGGGDVQLHAIGVPASEILLAIGVQHMPDAAPAEAARDVEEIDVADVQAVRHFKLEVSDAALAGEGQNKSIGEFFNLVLEPGEIADIAFELAFVAESFNAGVATIARDERRIVGQMDRPKRQPLYIYNHEHRMPEGLPACNAPSAECCSYTTTLPALGMWNVEYVTN
jgi:hypothetical protein